jgi:uncharacterized protein (UPF0548 family)
MFSLAKPTDAQIVANIAQARSLPLNYPAPLYTQFGTRQIQVPRLYKLDRMRTRIGQGIAAFEAAKTALRQWRHFDLGWVRVANPEAQIQPGEIVAVEAHSLGLWSINCSRILYVIDEPDRFGFGYGTTSQHVECGEERFLLEFDPRTEAVSYDLLAVSHPAHWLARLGYPYTRSRQRRFAHDSHAKLAQLIGHITLK